MEFKNYDAIVTAHQKKSQPKKDGEVVIDEVGKRKAKSKLRNKVSVAEDAVSDAQEAFNQAVATGGEIDATALTLKQAEDTYKFYKELFEKVFPNE